MRQVYFTLSQVACPVVDTPRCHLPSSQVENTVPSAWEILTVRRLRTSPCVKSKSWVHPSPVYHQPALDHPCSDPMPFQGDGVPGDFKALLGRDLVRFPSSRWHLPRKRLLKDQHWIFSEVFEQWLHGRKQSPSSQCSVCGPVFYTQDQKLLLWVGAAKGFSQLFRPCSSRICCSCAVEM